MADVTPKMTPEECREMMRKSIGELSRVFIEVRNSGWMNELFDCKEGIYLEHLFSSLTDDVLHMGYCMMKFESEIDSVLKQHPLDYSNITE